MVHNWALLSQYIYRKTTYLCAIIDARIYYTPKTEYVIILITTVHINSSYTVGTCPTILSSLILTPLGM